MTERVVVEEVTRKMWQLLRYPTRGGSRGIKAAADYLETFLRMHARRVREEVEREPKVRQYLR